MTYFKGHCLFLLKIKTITVVRFTAILQKFKEQGEKTGWTYIDIPAEIADKIKPNYKKSFRIKGTIDNYAFKSASILPMGEGDFILALNATIRKNIKKFLKGEKVILQVEEDNESIKLSVDLLTCLEDDNKANAFFLKLPKSHQNYYSKWIESAKTNATKAKRIAQAMHAFSNHWSYMEMMRANKENKLM
jgi:hypothetical protein